MKATAHKGELRQFKSCTVYHNEPPERRGPRSITHPGSPRHLLPAHKHPLGRTLAGPSVRGSRPGQPGSAPRLERPRGRPMELCWLGEPARAALPIQGSAGKRRRVPPAAGRLARSAIRQDKVKNKQIAALAAAAAIALRKIIEARWY